MVSTMPGDEAAAAQALRIKAEPNKSQRMRVAVDSAVELGPAFLRGEMDADAMAAAMLGAVRGYVTAEKADGRDGAPDGADSARLYPVLQELVACGGGYLAGRCDADCVARTMTQLVSEYGTPEPSGAAR